MKSKINIAIHLLKANGLRWFLLYLGERVFGNRVMNFTQKRAGLEICKSLPGFNTTRYNLREWSHYEWSEGGEEWSDSGPWKDALVKEVLMHYFRQGKTILEIGPGGGRWSEILAKISGRLILVDLTERSIELCKEKLRQYSHCRFYRNDGTDLSFLDRASVDYVWSFDVFVHLSPGDTESYLNALSHILVEGGIAVIHHPAEGGIKGGFRSSVTNDLFRRLLMKNNFRIIGQMDSWGEQNAYSVRRYKDMITIFSK